MEAAVMELIPVRQQTNRETMPLPLRGNIDSIQDLDVMSEFQSANVHSKQFIEANTSEVTLSHLRNECVIPVFSKDNEVTISHVNFIETNDTTDKNQADNKDTKTDYISHQLFILLQVKFLKSAN